MDIHLARAVRRDRAVLQVLSSVPTSLARQKMNGRCPILSWERNTGNEALKILLGPLDPSNLHTQCCADCILCCVLCILLCGLQILFVSLHANSSAGVPDSKRASECSLSVGIAALRSDGGHCSPSVTAASVLASDRLAWYHPIGRMMCCECNTYFYYHSRKCLKTGSLRSRAFATL